MQPYTIEGPTLTIPDPKAFGFDCGDLENPAFKIVADEYVRDRRSYGIHSYVMQHIESGRFFETEYSVHEDEGFEWGPGMGANCETKWTEVFPHVVATTVYKGTPAKQTTDGWHPITATEPADDDADVLLACNGSVIGVLTARWTDDDGEECWKVDDNLWDADDAPTHYLRLPPPPTEK